MRRLLRALQLRQLGLVIVALALASCQGAPAPRPSAAAQDVATLAASAMERGDYAKAADLYRRALASVPDSVPLHYGLGVCASYLERRDEAVREFLWVLERADAGSAEARAARRWLASVGALPRRAPDASAETEEPREQAPTPTTGVVHGRVMTGETANNAVPADRALVFLMEHPSRIKYFRLRTDEQGYFRFENVPPGVYKLTERAAGHPLWRLRVEVKPGQEVALDLGPTNTTAVRDDFPDGTLAVGPRTP
jgi:tetratricopeptide (TPR) repeat protein